MTFPFAGLLWGAQSVRSRSNARVSGARLFSRVFPRLFAVVLALAFVTAGVPSSATEVKRAKYIAGGDGIFCAIAANDDLYCWGDVGPGVGSGIASSASTPVLVAGGYKWRTISTTGNVACGQLVSGDVYCWGSAVGDADPYGRPSGIPLKVAILSSSVLSVSAASSYACAVDGDGSVYCWGDNSSKAIGSYADVGDSTTTPIRISGLPEAALSVSSGVTHSCALTRSRRVYCWGANTYGQIGDGNISYSGVPPTQVVGLTQTVEAVYAGSQATCVLMQRGAMKCWGRAAFMAGVGVGSGAVDVTVPTDVPGRSSGVTSVVMDQLGALSVLASGTVDWGASKYGLPVVGLELSTSIAAGDYRTACALSANGNIQCSGNATGGRLGNGENSDKISHYLPVDVVGFSSVLGALTEYRHPTLDYYFATSRSAEKVLLDRLPEWTRTGKSIAVATVPVSGGDSVNRFYFDQVARGGTRGSHFYTSLASEKGVLRALNPANAILPKLPYDEGVESWAIRRQNCQFGTAVYRLFRGNTRFPDDPNHRFVTDKALYDEFVARGWDGEGIVFCAWP